jgi:hypothetical protein
VRAGEVFRHARHSVSTLLCRSAQTVAPVSAPGSPAPQRWRGARRASRCAASSRPPAGRRVHHKRLEYADGLVGVVLRLADRLRRSREALNGRVPRVPRRRKSPNRAGEILQEIGRQPVGDERVGVRRDAIEEPREYASRSSSLRRPAGCMVAIIASSRFTTLPTFTTSCAAS